jgi:hypothetical protein
MASFKLSVIFTLFLTISMLHLISAARKLTESDQQLKFQYHKGPLLTRNISINLIWYGKFKPSQRAIITDFITSLSSPKQGTTTSQPSVATWWKSTEKYYQLTNNKKSAKLALSLGAQILDENYSLGKSLTTNQILKLASKGQQKNAINVVLTAADVLVDGFCSSRCGTHGSSYGARVNGKRNKFAYIWVGNSETQCAGQCTWPFHQPIYGPQSAPLVAPNNDVGLLVMDIFKDQKKLLWKLLRLVPVFTLKELILVMLGPFWWTKQVVLATTLMVIMEGSICCLRLLILKLQLVLHWYKEIVFFLLGNERFFDLFIQLVVITSIIL